MADVGGAREQAVSPTSYSLLLLPWHLRTLRFQLYQCFASNGWSRQAYQNNFGYLRCTGAGARTYPPDRDRAGYTYWSDLSYTVSLTLASLPFSLPLSLSLSLCVCVCVCLFVCLLVTLISYAIAPLHVFYTTTTIHHRHRDEYQPNSWPIPKSRTIKGFVYLSEIGEDSGPLALVPGRSACLFVIAVGLYSFDVGGV